MSEKSSTPLPVVRTDQTTAGGYFVSNYPPFQFWLPEHVPDAVAVFNRPPPADEPLGLYVHIPFCRKRCHFCYFKVYTDKNADQIGRYVDAVLAEARCYAEQLFLSGRGLRFVYFGGGTPSYLSASQLTHLIGGLQDIFSWNRVEEVAFECEPGTLRTKKLATLHELGITRLSLGIENFNDRILETNNRAHDSAAIDRAFSAARDVGFPQINIDLIAGMVGETDKNWRDCVDRTIKMEPDSITIYQMEVPFNTTLFKQMQRGGQVEAPVADWPTKRRWVSEAFSRLEEVGYTVASAYTAVQDPAHARFIYRDDLWRGADMLGIGVSSFGHIGGVHYQNEKDFDPYIEQVESGEFPIHRALEIDSDQRLIRELVLQFKIGHVDGAYFRAKFNVAIEQRFTDALLSLQQAGHLCRHGDRWQLSREALLQVDDLLPAFFQPEHRAAIA